MEPSTPQMPPRLSDAALLQHLGKVLYEGGDYQEAEEVLRRALELTAREPGPLWQVVGQLVSLAAALLRQGRVGEAMALLERTLDLSLRTLAEGQASTSDPVFATLLGTLGTAYHSAGRLDDAASLLKRAQEMQEQTLGAQHPALAVTLDNLAGVYQSQGLLIDATALLERSRDIRQATLGLSHPQVAVALNNLALVYRDQRRFLEAEALLLRAEAIFAEALGPTHPELSVTLFGRATVALAQRQGATAAALLLRSLEIREAQLRTSLTEARTRDLLRMMSPGTWLSYGLPSLFPQEPQATALALTTALLTKGRTQEVGTLANQALWRSLQTVEQRAGFERLRALLAERERGLDSGSVDPARVQRLLELAERQEQALVEQAGGVGIQAFPRPADMRARVAEGLPADAALVEIVLAGTADYALGADAKRTAQRHYAALVLFPDQRLELVSLGEQGVVERSVDALLGALSSEATPLSQAQQRGQEVYQQVFAPIERILGGRRRLILCADGALQLIPWGALHDGRQHLLDRYSIRSVGSGRELLERPAAGTGTPALVLADPALRSTQHQRLTRARIASDHIAELLGVQALKDEQASEAALRTARGPFVLHLATHGVLRAPVSSPPARAPLPTADEPAGQLFARPRGQPLLPVIGVSALWGLSDPMHRSAVLLAPGAQPQDDAQQDGWLTGDEVKTLDLRGTQLVTLLSCESGRGGISAGQGVYGLRRAFQLAGAETVVSALWSVSENTASRLIAGYYTHLLTHKQGRVEALEEAMREVRAVAAHPYHWAPFVVLGRDGPLRVPDPEGTRRQSA